MTAPSNVTESRATIKTAKQRFDELLVEDTTPLERLRFFCSLAMNGQDWLDVEPFFDALSNCSSVGEPSLDRTVANEIRDAIRNVAIEECAKVAFDMPLNSAEERHEYRWSDTYKAAALDIASAIRALKNAAPQAESPRASDGQVGAFIAPSLPPVGAAPATHNATAASTLPESWREAIRQIRINLDAGGRSTSHHDFMHTHGGALLDKVEEALEALPCTRSATAARTVRPATLAEALSILKSIHPLSPAEQRDIDEAIRCIVAFDGVTDEMVERALEAANGAMVDTRRHWTDGDKAAVRAMLEAVIEAVPPKRSTVEDSAQRFDAWMDGWFPNWRGECTKDRIREFREVWNAGAAFAKEVYSRIALDDAADRMRWQERVIRSDSIPAPYLPLPWHYENRGDDASGGRFGDIVSDNGKVVADAVYEKDALLILAALSATASRNEHAKIHEKKYFSGPSRS